MLCRVVSRSRSVICRAYRTGSRLDSSCARLVKPMIINQLVFLGNRQMLQTERKMPWPPGGGSHSFFVPKRDEWCVLMEGIDVCFAPVLSMTEAPGAVSHRHACC